MMCGDRPWPGGSRRSRTAAFPPPRTCAPEGRRPPVQSMAESSPDLDYNDPASEPHVRLEMLSQARFLAGARAMISNLAQRLGFNEIHCGQISLAVDEALCNIINHGYSKKPDGRIWLNIWALESDPPAMHIVIEDRARQVDPATIRSRDL